MKTNERHHLKDNELAHVLGDAQTWANDNSKSLVTTVAAIVIVGGSVLGFMAWRNTYFVVTDRRVIFRSGFVAKRGVEIPLDRIKGLDENQLAALFGPGVLDRKDDPARALRYQSDACSLFVYVSAGKAQHTEAYDPQLRPLMNVDQCAGSVAAQKRTA